MDQQQVFVRRGLGRDEILGRGEAFAQQAVADHAEFLRGKNVAAEIEIVALVIDQVERQHLKLRWDAWLRLAAR